MRESANEVDIERLDVLAMKWSNQASTVSRSIRVHLGPPARRTIVVCVAALALYGAVPSGSPSALPNSSASMESAPRKRYAAVAFDYFVLFNPDSVVSAVERVFPGKGRAFTDIWRTRQFEYSWLRSLMGRLAMLAVCLTFLMMIADQGVGRRIPVAVVAPKGVTDFLVRRICAEAQAIWKPAGIAFESHRVGSSDEARRWPLEVTIDDRRSSVDPDGALGWLTFTNDGPDRAIHLSRASTEGLLRRTSGAPDTTVASHEILLGRALGRALAHECGHYLLRSKAHTTRGLMRAAWTSAEFFAFNGKGFELTATASSSVRPFVDGLVVPGIFENRVVIQSL